MEVFPSELLGSQNEMVQLTQTGAINFCVASNSLLETFSQNYTLFNLPYLFVFQRSLPRVPWMMKVYHGTHL